MKTPNRVPVADGGVSSIGHSSHTNRRAARHRAIPSSGEAVVAAMQSDPLGPQIGHTVRVQPRVVQRGSDGNCPRRNAGTAAMITPSKPGASRLRRTRCNAAFRFAGATICSSRFRSAVRLADSAAGGLGRRLPPVGGDDVGAHAGRPFAVGFRSWSFH
jgi:hypothetical protein